MGFKDYMTHVEALLYRWVAKTLENANTKWAAIFITLTKEFTWEQRRAHNNAQYNDTNWIMFGTSRNMAQ